MANRARVQEVPYAIQGLAADFDADDLLASLADTDPVTTWEDATGNGNDVGNTGTNRPAFDAENPAFNGHASVNFAKASTQYLFASTGALITAMSGTDKPATVFVACRRSTKAIGAEECLWSFGNSGSGTNSYVAGLHNNGSSQQRQRLRIREDGATAESNDTSLSEIIDLGPFIDIISLSGTAGNGYIIGESQNPHYDATVADGLTVDYTAQGTITLNRFAIGAFLRSTATLACDVEIARVLVYTRELNEAERVRVANYLWNRYCNFGGTTILPDSILDSLIHSWDAAGVSALAGETIATISDGAGGKTFSSPLSTNRPTCRVDPVSGKKYAEFDGVDNYMQAGVAADWQFLHDGTDYTLALVYRPKSAASALTPLLDTVDNDTSATGHSGIGIYHDAVSAAHSIQVKIGATNATPVLNHDSQDYGDRPDTWHVLILTREGTIPASEENYTITLDNELYVASDQGVTPNAVAPDFALTLGALAGAGTFGQFDFQALLIFDRKLGRPGELQILGEVLARNYATSHAALVGGNGLAGVLNDGTPNRSFSALCMDGAGMWHCIYRRAATHGSSRGVGVIKSSADGIRWSDERVIYDVDDADGRDFRAEGGFIRLKQGANAGRLLYFTKWSADDSNIYVAGKRSTLLIGYSDDNGGSWTWFDPLENEGDISTWNYTASPNGLIELQTGPNPGRILATFSMNDTDTPGGGVVNQDIRLFYSDDGGLTWSPTVVIYEHDTDLGVDKRATETHIIEFADGELVMSVRNDTDKRIEFARSDSATPTVWVFDAGTGIGGYGRPVMAIDPNDGEAVFLWHRSDTTDLTVWRYSTDRCATWSTMRAVSNLHSTTTVAAYTAMSYCFPAFDNDGNLWVSHSMDVLPDSDVFVRRWANVE